MMLAAAGSAHAMAGAYSSSSIDVGSLNITPGTGMTYTLQTFESTGYSVSPTDFQVGSETSLTDSTYNFAGTTAAADFSMINQLSIVSADGLGSYYATAQSVFDSFFTVSGSGNITITANYDLFLQLFADIPSWESASGMSRASLLFFNSTTYGSASDVQQLLFATPGDYLGTQSDVLTVTLFFNDGDTGSFRLIVEGEAFASSVPEPSMLAFLGIGIFGVAMLRKRIY
jgi:hypothetical protein